MGVHEKERELNIEPRLFGLLSIRKRLYVADHILPYFLEITMTSDSTTILETIQRQTSKLKEVVAQKHSVKVNLDFQKWNSNMKYEEKEKVCFLILITSLVVSTYPSTTNK
jgi:uncharacterized membrane protein